jgi:hypothetical protein
VLEVSREISQAIDAARPRLVAIEAAVASAKPSPDDWSRKEILGHLIDSAANNHQRVVRGARNAAADFPPYDRVAWVEVQRYQEASWPDLVELFCQVNRHLCRAIEGLPPEALANPCDIGKDAPVTLEFVVTDYLRHLKMHLGDILEPA